MELNLQRTYKLAKLYESNPKMRRLIQDFLESFVQMLHTEGFDPRTVKFEMITPKGEPNKLVLTLQEAQYLDGQTLEQLEERENVRGASYQFVRVLRSFYASLLAENGRMQGLVDACSGLCDCIFNLGAYMLERYDCGRKLRGYAISCGDNAAGDLVFFIHLED